MKMSDTTNKTMNIKKVILAIHMAMPSSPQMPKNPATNANTKNANAKRNMLISVLELWS